MFTFRIHTIQTLDGEELNKSMTKKKKYSCNLQISFSLKQT